MNDQFTIDMTHVKEAAQLIEDAALRSDEVAILRFTRELNNHLITGCRSEMIADAWFNMMMANFTKQEIEYVAL